MFSAMRAWLTVLATRMIPRWTHHRPRTCAGVLRGRRDDQSQRDMMCCYQPQQTRAGSKGRRSGESAGSRLPCVLAIDCTSSCCISFPCVGNTHHVTALEWRRSTKFLFTAPLTATVLSHHYAEFSPGFCLPAEVPDSFGSPRPCLRRRRGSRGGTGMDSLRSARNHHTATSRFYWAGGRGQHAREFE
jgi:hypothetical protein